MGQPCGCVVKGMIGERIGKPVRRKGMSDKVIPEEFDLQEDNACCVFHTAGGSLGVQ